MFEREKYEERDGVGVKDGVFDATEMTDGGYDGIEVGDEVKVGAEVIEGVENAEAEVGREK